ncbi:hypothetical protein AB0911_35830 [Streptomyces nigra]|uniref:hypothetical protein n=1 Tax=Streptomyces nigra TaxID=1827580 RepID=UPI003452B5E2
MMPVAAGPDPVAEVLELPSSWLRFSSTSWSCCSARSAATATTVLDVGWPRGGGWCGVECVHGGGGVPVGQAVDLLRHRPLRGQGIAEIRRLTETGRGGHLRLAKLGELSERAPEPFE